MNTFPSNIKQKFNSTIPDMADHSWPFTQKRYLRCSIYIITNNTIIYDYPKTRECTLCEHSIVMNNRMHALRAFYCLRFRLRNLYAVCIHIIGVLPDQLGDGNWLIALILQIVDQVRKRLCGINSSGMEQEDRAVLELATV